MEFEKILIDKKVEIRFKEDKLCPCCEKIYRDNINVETLIDSYNGATDYNWCPKYSLANNTIYFGNATDGKVEYSQSSESKIENYALSCNNTCGSGNVAGNWDDKYRDIDKCTDIDIKYIKACGCIPAEVADIVSKIYFILRIIGPVLLLIIGGFEMAKAIIAQDESAIEKAKKKLINKFIAAAAIFLVLTVIKFIVEIVGADSNSIMECVEILLNGYVI